MTRDWLDVDLALEEHRQGKPLGERGHCRSCDDAVAQADRALVQANCRHSEMIELATFDKTAVQGHCVDCGLSVPDIRAWEIRRRWEWDHRGCRSCTQ